jgi:hypothetical protein
LADEQIHIPAVTGVEIARAPRKRVHRGPGLRCAVTVVPD